MIIVDDHLCVEALGGRLDVGQGDDAVATTWGFHYRLVRALADDRRFGRLTRATPARLRQAVTDPPPARLVVLDPRSITNLAAELAGRRSLNLLTAELLASAIHHRATVVVAEGNVGRTWRTLFESEEVELKVRSR